MKGARKMNFMKNLLSILVILGIMLSVSVCFGEDAKANSSNPVVLMQTSMGDITIELYKDKAPKSVANFLEYVRVGFYNGTIFHRVIKTFMIQGGGFTEKMGRKTGLRAPIENEATNGLKNEIGTIAMARTGEVNSATSQFFINTGNNASLNNRGTTPETYGYAVFGKVIEGMDVVKKIASVETAMNESGEKSQPTQVISIKSVTIKAQ
jgi:cyclophilin family peptidyl-prolyl cis-trans isomerase